MRNEVVSHDEWFKARLELLVAEKEFTRERDALYHVSFTPEEVAEGRAYYNYEVRPIDASDEQGISVFHKDGRGEVFHTYSCHGRGIDMVNGAYQFLDLVPKSRDEEGLGLSMEWLRRHDQY